MSWSLYLKVAFWGLLLLTLLAFFIYIYFQKHMKDKVDSAIMGREMGDEEDMDSPDVTITEDSDDDDDRVFKEED